MFRIEIGEQVGCTIVWSVLEDGIDTEENAAKTMEHCRTTYPDVLLRINGGEAGDEIVDTSSGVRRAK